MFICLTNGIHGSETSHNAIIKPTSGTFQANLQNNYKEASFGVQSQAARPGKAAFGLGFRRDIIPLV